MDRQIARQTARQTARHIARQTARHIARQTARQIDKHIIKWTLLGYISKIKNEFWLSIETLIDQILFRMQKIS